jgi:SAM-dependent methyltransferase
MSKRYSSIWIVRTILNKEVIRAAGQFKGKFLDIGCGAKPYKKYFSGSGSNNYVGLDWSNSFHGMKMDGVADMLNLPFGEERFDGVLCTQALEHCRDPWRAIREASRVIKRKGCLLLSVPFFYHEHELPWDYYRYTDKGIEYILEIAGFKVEYINPTGGPFVAVAVSLSRTLVIILNTIWWYLNKLIALPLRGRNSKIVNTIETAQGYINLVFTGILQVPVYFLYLISRGIFHNRRNWPIFRQFAALGEKMCREITPGYFIKAIKK